MAGHVKKRGEGRWRARHPDPLKGGTAQIERTFKTKGAADEWLDAMRTNVRQGAGAYVSPNDAERTFGEVAAEWRSTWVKLAPKTKAGYEAILNRHVLPRFGNAKLGAISPAAVQAYVTALATPVEDGGEGKAHNTVRRIYSVTQAVFARAVQLRYLAVSPCDAVVLPADGRAPVDQVVLTHEEVRALADEIDPHYRLLVLTAAYTGMRSGELRALRRGRVIRATVHVKEALKEVHSSSEHIAARDKGLIFGPTKTHAERAISLPDFLRVELEAHLAGPLPGGAGPQALLFTTPSGTPIRQSLFYRRVFKPAVYRALPAEKHGLRFHDLRHTCATLLVAAGVHPLAIKQRLGHKDIQMTMNVYGHLFPSAEAALADVLDAGYDQAAAPTNVTPLRAAS